MGKSAKNPDELKPVEETPDAGAVAAQEPENGIQPSVDTPETNAAVEVPVEPQEVTIDLAYSAKYRVNYRYGLNLRTGPGREHPVIRVLPNGMVILVEGDAVAVGPVVWCQTGEGWVDSTYLVPVEEG